MPLSRFQRYVLIDMLLSYSHQNALSKDSDKKLIKYVKVVESHTIYSPKTPARMCCG